MQQSLREYDQELYVCDTVHNLQSSTNQQLTSRNAFRGSCRLMLHVSANMLLCEWNCYNAVTRFFNHIPRLLAFLSMAVLGWQFGEAIHIVLVALRSPPINSVLKLLPYLRSVLVQNHTRVQYRTRNFFFSPLESLSNCRGMRRFVACKPRVINIHVFLVQRLRSLQGGPGIKVGREDMNRVGQ